MLKAKRFWKTVSVQDTDGGFGVSLDGRAIRTPGKAALVVPTRAAADMIALEWEAVESDIDPRTMPTTRWANSAIEKVTPQKDGVVAMLSDYGATDLLCYRASSPAGLVARQADAWDVPLAWARDALDAPLIVTEGVQPVTQPGASLARLRAELEAFDPFALTAVHDLIVISGSLVLGLAVAHRAQDVGTAWAASRVDEDWQISQWGADSEAESAARAKEADFKQAARVLEALRT